MFWNKKRANQSQKQGNRADIEKKSIYDIITEKITKDGLPSDFEIEPDEAGSGIYFQRGARDGIALFQFGVGEPEDEQKTKIIRAIFFFSQKKIEEAELILNELFENGRMLTFVDFVQEQVLEKADIIDLRNLVNGAWWEILTSNNQECVKFGLTILALIVTDGNEEIREVIRELALYEEFTFFCLCIMSNWEDAEEEMLQIGKKVHGWGRVHVVHFIKAEQIWTKQWLLTEGVDNDVLLNYSAYECYRKGNMFEKLDTFPTDEEFRGACWIMDGLLDEGPMDGISQVEEANELFKKFLSHYYKRTISVDQYELVRAILYYLEGEEKTSEVEEVIDMCRGILHSDQCVWVVSKAAREGKAPALARAIGLDFSKAWLSLLKSDCKKYSHLAKFLMDDEENVEWVVAIFEEAYDDLVTGKGDALWTFDDDVLAEIICLQELKTHVGKGVSLLKKASFSSVRQLRNMVLNVAEEWMKSSGKKIVEISPSFNEVFVEMLRNEQDDELRLRIKGVLENQIYEPKPIRIG